MLSMTLAKSLEETMLNQSESIANLTLALSIVQGKMSHAVKDSANPFFKSKYADLESVWDACRSLLADNGLAVMQFPGLYTDHDKSMSLTTIISHKSGEYISQEMSVPVTKADAQGAGSALTYMRRYALAAVVGVVQADDDGNAASSPKPVVKAKDI
jgi:ERF superfamily